jgi:tetratricopeptide (TPR) repeat protein
MRSALGCFLALAALTAPARGQDSVWQSYFDAGNKAFDAKKWEEAVKYYKLAVKEGDRQGLQNLAMAVALHNVGAAHTKLEKYEEAIPYLERASVLYGKAVQAYHEDNIRDGNLLGLCYHRVGRHEEAVTFLAWAVKAVDESGKLTDLLPGTLFNLGLSRIETGDLKGAEAAFRRSRKLYAQKELVGAEGDCLRHLARVAAKRKDDDAALDLYQEAAERYALYSKEDKAGIPFVTACFDEMVSIRERQKKPEAVAALHRRLEEVLAKSGTAGRKALAARYYDRATSEKGASRYKEAEALARKAIEAFDLAGVEPDTYVFAHALLGQVLARRGEGDAAAKEFKRAVALADDFTPADKIDRRWVYARYAEYLAERGKHADALPLYEKGLAAAEKKDGPDADSVATALSDLVSAYGELKRWDDARAAAERQLAIVEKAKGEDSPAVVGPIQQLAWVLEKQKQAGKAEALLKRGLAIREKAGGPGNADTFASVQRLARLYQSDNRPDEAEKLYRRTVADWEKALGAEHPDLAVAMKGLASFLSDAGKFVEAEKLFRQALANREKAHGPNHRTVADSLDDLAGFYHELGRQAEAEPLYKRALKVYEATDGPRTAAVASTLNGLGWVYIRQGRFDDGVPLARKALAIHEELGERPRTLARSCNTLASLLDKHEQNSEAEALYRKAIKFYEQDDAPDQLGLAMAVHNLAILCRSTDRHEEAETLYSRSIAIQERAGINTAEGVTAKLNRAGNLARAHGNLASLLSDLDRNDEALAHAKKALEIREKYLGKEHPDVARSLSQLAGLAAERGEYVVREALYTRAAELRKKLYAADGDIALAGNHTEAAVLHRYHGRLDEADAAYRKAEAMYDKHYDGNPAHLVGLWEARGGLLTGTGRFEEARKLLRKALDYHEKSRPGTTGHAAAMLAMAGHEYAVGEFEAAERREAAAIKIYAKVYGTDARATRGLVTRQASADRRAGRYADARAKYLKLLAEYEKDAPNTPDYLGALQHVAWMDVLEGKRSGLTRLEEALALAEKFHGPDPYHKAALLTDQAEALLRAGKAADAEAPARAVYEAYTKRLGADHPTTAAAALQLGRIVAASGKPADAAKLIAAAKAVRYKLYPADHPETADTRRAEAELAAASGKPADAAKLYAKAVKLRDAKFDPGHPETLRLLADYLAVLEKAGRSDDAKAVKERLGTAKPVGGR